MIGEKVQQFQGKGTDLNDLQGKIESYLQSEGFTVQTSPPSAQGTVIQAKKGGFLSEVIAADRALDDPHLGRLRTTSRYGSGSESGSSTSASQRSRHCSSPALFLVVDVAEMAWNLEIEDKLAKQIESFVG